MDMEGKKTGGRLAGQACQLCLHQHAPRQLIKFYAAFQAGRLLSAVDFGHSVGTKGKSTHKTTSVSSYARFSSPVLSVSSFR